MGAGQMKTVYQKIEYELPLFVFLSIKTLYELPYLKPTFASFSAIFLCGFIAWLLGGIIRRADSNLKTAVIFFIAFLLAGSVLNGIVFAGNFINRWLVVKNALLVFGLFVTFVSVNKTSDRWRIPIVCFVCCSMQPFFAVFYLPAVLTLLFYHPAKEKPSPDKLLIATVIAAAVAAFFLFGKMFIVVEGVNQISFALLNLKVFAYSVAIIAPLFLILILFWIEMIKAGSNKQLKTVVILILLAPGISLFSLFITNPPFSFISMAILFQLCFFFYFLSAKDPVFLLALKKFSGFLGRHLTLALLSLIYLAAFSLNTNNSRIGNWLGH